MSADHLPEAAVVFVSDDATQHDRKEKKVGDERGDEVLLVLRC